VFYTCVLWKLFGKYFSTLFPLFFRFLCMKRPNGDPVYVRTVFLVVRTIRLIRPDEHVFMTSTWHYVQTSLKFRPDGEHCRVKSHSPWCRTSFSPLLLCFFVVLCVFLVLFMRISLLHVSSLDFISSPGMYLYSFTNFLKFSCLK
jgi:hypothetical protein